MCRALLLAGTILSKGSPAALGAVHGGNVKVKARTHCCDGSGPGPALPSPGQAWVWASWLLLNTASVTIKKYPVSLLSK